MAYQTEPPHHHGQAPRTAVLYCNLGTPDAPTPSAVRRYLAQFLSDRRVVELPRLLWWPLLHGLVLRTRPARSAAKYASIWTPSGSPLWVHTQHQADQLQAALDARGQSVIVRFAMRYGTPSIEQTLDALKALNVQRLLLLPAYPQYSGTTTASVIDSVSQWNLRTRLIPEQRFVNRFHDHPGYIQALAQTVRAHWQEHGRGQLLVMSFHGVPARTLHLGDPYHCECHKTARLLAQALGLDASQYTVTFQSRFGKAKWLEPYTEPTLKALARSGTHSVDVMCPGFVSDCLETLEEIQDEAQQAFLQAGGQRFRYIACLNSHPAWIQALADLCLQHMQGWPNTVPDEQALRDSKDRAIALGAST